MTCADHPPVQRQPLRIFRPDQQRETLVPESTQPLRGQHPGAQKDGFRLLPCLLAFYLSFEQEVQLRAYLRVRHARRRPSGDGIQPRQPYLSVETYTSHRVAQISPPLAFCSTCTNGTASSSSEIPPWPTIRLLMATNAVRPG